MENWRRDFDIEVERPIQSEKPNWEVIGQIHGYPTTPSPHSVVVANPHKPPDETRAFWHVLAVNVSGVEIRQAEAKLAWLIKSRNTPIKRSFNGWWANGSHWIDMIPGKPYSIHFCTKYDHEEGFFPYSVGSFEQRNDRFEKAIGLGIHELAVKIYSGGKVGISRFQVNNVGPSLHDFTIEALNE